MDSRLINFLRAFSVMPFVISLQAQTFVQFSESPVGSNLFTDQFSANYAAVGEVNGVQRIFNAVEGDRLTVVVETALQVNSSPRIRLADAANVTLATAIGDARGRGRIENFRIPAPGVYTLTIFSTNAASAFDAQVLLGRGFELETEDNDIAGSADKLTARANGDSFTLNMAGILNGGPDWIDLGMLTDGGSVEISVQKPASSSLDLSGLRVSLWRDGETAAQAVASGGAALTHAVSGNGRYRAEITIPGPSGQYLRFNGDDAHVNLGTPTALQITGSQTVEFWVKPDRLGIRQNPYEKAYGGEGTMTIETGGDINYFYGTNGGNALNYQGVNSVAALRTGEWAHVALVRDFESSPPRIRWYFNGVLTSEVEAQYLPATAGSLDFRIGTGYTNGFAGSLDEFRVWNVARSGAEILAGMAATPAAATPGLVASYSFEEGSGSTIEDGSGNGLDGTVAGSLEWLGGGGQLASFGSQGINGTWFTEVNVADTTPAVVTGSDLIPFSSYLFDGTTSAPTNMIAERENNGSEYLFTVVGSTSGTLRGTDLYTDDSSVARAAVHAGILAVGERGAVRVTVRPGADRYEFSTRYGTASSYSGAFAGSFTIERYEPAAPFTHSAIYNQL